MAQHRLGIIMNGVTGRMGMNQHLIRSIVAIRAQGGVTLKNGDRVMPDPILVGRNAEKLAALAKAHGIDALDHRPRRGAEEPGRHAVLRCGHHATARRAVAQGDRRPASTSIARSRSPIISPTHSIWSASRRRPGSSMAWCRTSCSSRPAQAAHADRVRVLRPYCSRCAASSVTGCLKATGSPPTDPRGTTASRTAAASFSTCCATGATCSTICSARSSVSLMPGRDPYSQAR